jgi:2-haloacid dehalogenase
MTTLAFDVYGTLIDTNAVENSLGELIGDKAPALSKLWREKQLEYSFRRGLMKRYRDFSICTRDALDYACAVMKITLSDQDKNTLLAAYRSLPAFADVVPALEDLHNANYPLIAFSNGSRDAVQALLDHAEIRQYFTDIVSVEEIKTFKPDPDVYLHLLARCESSAASTWLISGNPFDVMGAVSAGLKGAWLQRDADTIFDPWDDLSPTTKINLLTKLSAAIQ